MNSDPRTAGYEHYWGGRSPKTLGFARIIVEVADHTRRRLPDLVATEGGAPGQIAGRSVTDYFDGDGGHPQPPNQ